MRCAVLSPALQTRSRRVQPFGCGVNHCRPALAVKLSNLLLPALAQYIGARGLAHEGFGGGSGEGSCSRDPWLLVGGGQPPGGTMGSAGAAVDHLQRSLPVRHGVAEGEPAGRRRTRCTARCRAGPASRGRGDPLLWRRGRQRGRERATCSARRPTLPGEDGRRARRGGEIGSSHLPVHGDMTLVAHGSVGPWPGAAALGDHRRIRSSPASSLDHPIMSLCLLRRG